MDYIHCHLCYRRFEPDVKFYITSCGHTFCIKCSPSNLIPRCFTCSRLDVQAVPIDKQMPENVAVYFSQNLAEEQNLLTRKYEFQLFQFKHLYKHMANSVQAYEIVCKQIDKNLNEFKKCTSYLKLPKCSLLTNNKESQNRTPRKVQPHVKQLPYLPSPVGNSFSDTPNKNMSGPSQAAKQQMNVPRMMPNKIRIDSQMSHSQHNLSQSQRHSQMSQLQQNLSQSQRHSQMSQLQQNLSQSQRHSQMSQSQQNLLQSQRDSQMSQSQHNLSQSQRDSQMSQSQHNLSQSQRHSQMSQSQRDSQMSQSQRDSQMSQSQHNLSQSRKPRQNMSQSQNLYRNTKGPMCSLNASICSAPSPSQHRGGPVPHSQSQRTHQSQHMSNPQPLHGHSANPLQIRVPAHPRLTPTPQGYSQGIRNSNDGSHRSHPGRPLHRTDSMSSSLSKMSTTPSLSSCQSRITTTPSLNNSMRSESSRSRCPSDRVKKLNLTPQMCALQSSRTPQQMVQGTSKYPLTQKINFLQIQRQASQQSQHGDPLRHGGMKRNETNERMDRNNNALKLQNGMINRRPSASRSSQEERERSKQFTQSPFTKYRKPQSSPAILNTPHFQSGGKPPNVNTPLSASSGTPTPPNGYRLVSPRTSSSLSSSNSRSRQEVPYNRPSGSSRPNEQRIQEGACRKSMGSSRPVEMKTPSHSPVYKQSNPAPPFQETLKMLTAAIKKSKI